MQIDLPHRMNFSCCDEALLFVVLQCFAAILGYQDLEVELFCSASTHPQILPRKIFQVKNIKNTYFKLSILEILGIKNTNYIPSRDKLRQDSS